MLIPTAKNTKTITDMREDALGVLKDVEKIGITYIFHHSKPKVVMLPVETFVRLNEILEDYFEEQELQKILAKPVKLGKSLAEINKEYGL